MDLYLASGHLPLIPFLLIYFKILSMKKIYLLTCLFVIAISCQKEGIISPITDTSFSDQESEAIAFDNLPANIKDNFDNTNHIKFKSGKVKSRNPFGTAKTNSQVIKNINNKGLASYTIALNKINSTRKSESKNLLYFDNLSITDLGNDNVVKYIFRYIPDNNWYDMGKQMSTYSGKIEIYNLSGTKLSDMTLVQGKQIAKDHLKLNDELICMYYMVSMVCTELIMEGDTETTEICTFTYELDYCTTSSSSSGGSTINTNTNQGSIWNGESTTGGSPGTIPDDTEIIDTTPLLIDDRETIDDKIEDIDLDPCSKTILDKIRQGNSIENIVNQFAKENSNFNWKLETSNTSVDATTDWDGQANNYLTKINPDYKNSATKLAIARTLIHEAIHAYTLSFIDLAKNGDPSLSLKTFPELWNDLVAKKYGDSNTPSGWNEYHHEEMARNYVNVISNAIAAWDDNSHNPSYYRDLAWGGLLETQIFQSTSDLTDIDRLRIEKNNFAEDVNSPDALGNPCN